MRVLLFVQTGDARPMYAADVTSRYIGGSGNSTWSSRACQKQRAADHWWLVECENADAGRRCISNTDCQPNDDGRILASGGRR